MNIRVHRGAMALLLMVATFATCTSVYADQLLVVGDSWAWQRVPTLQSVLNENGHGDVEVIQAETRLYASGLKLPDRLEELTALLLNYPDATMMHLSIGANDLETVRPFLTETEKEVERLETMIADVDIIVDHILSLRPNIRILWSSYDFFRPRRWGTPHESNSAFLRLTERSAEYALTRAENMTYSDINGLLQVTYGFDGVQHTEYDPPEAIPPGSPSLPNPELPSPAEAFKEGDNSHLTEAGYRVLAEAQYKEYYGPLLGDAQFQINPGLNDAWYNEATGGQGFLITVFPDIRQMFLAWFTFDTERTPENVTAVLGEPGHRWLTAQGPYEGDTAELSLYVTRGGEFDSAEPPAKTDSNAIGSLNIEFADCSNALASYDLPELGFSGAIPIKRIVPDSVPLCQALNEQSQAAQ